MFVHGLVKVTDQKKHGWKAPAELGETSPHYVSFVVPLDDANELADEYTCEVVEIESQNRRIAARKLVKAGTDSLVLELPKNVRIWFHLRGVGRDERRLRYVGKLTHDDFQGMLSEIEPNDNAELDRLCEEHRTFIIGCDPELHYAVTSDRKNRSAEPSVRKKSQA